ncbi:unannotated protein [freshwater metagenome]|uniref:Unannotated protein n=1 Tax=freshwater metagenome TaxID=449393 RepID=A0A6J6AFS5_9ZZZZ
MSPICKPDVLIRPITSPGNASSIVSRSEPNAVVAYFVPTFFAVRAQSTSIPRSNLPEQIRAKAMRSRWFGSILAWILKMKAANSASNGRASPSTSGRGAGAGAKSTTASRSICTPKLVIAEPTKTGVLSPAKKLSTSKSAPIASSRPHPSRACFQAGPSSIAACSALTISSGAIDDPRATRVNRTKSPVRRSITPRKSPD